MVASWLEPAAPPAAAAAQPGDFVAFDDTRAPLGRRRYGILVDRYTGPGGRPLADVLVYVNGGGERIFTVAAADLRASASR
ncbi:MAG TPA: hypothetical protein VFL91_21210 [Thermomicrobiales bacterium]|nr:hypothetical protein [Thermomicrobiales bacterium]